MKWVLVVWLLNAHGELINKPAMNVITAPSYEACLDLGQRAHNSAKKGFKHTETLTARWNCVQLEGVKQEEMEPGR